MAKTITSANSIFNPTPDYGYVIGPAGDPASATDGKLTVEVDGTIHLNKGNAILVDGVSKANLTIKGQVIASDGLAIYATSTAGLFTVNVSDTGSTSSIYSEASLILNNAGMISGEVEGAWFLDNADTIKNAGTITSFVNVDRGTDKVENSGHIGLYVKLGNGSDTIKNSGTIGQDIFLDLDFKDSTGDGDDSFANSGLVTGSVYGGAGEDVLKNTGKIEGDFYAGDGNDNLSNSGTISLDVFAGKGNDTFKNSGQVLDNISMGAGNDIFVGGNFTDVVFDEEGSDNYKLGGGDDYFECGPAALGADIGTDIVDGGSNSKVNFALGMWGDVYSVDGGVVDLAVGLATGLGTDQIKGFETVISHGYCDALSGDKFANGLRGYEGNDQLKGRGGADWLEGGADADQFIYDAVSDSTVSLKGRDTIADFEDGVDKIVLNEAGLGLSLLDFVGGGPFTASSGLSEVRVFYNGVNATGKFTYLLQIDANMDGKADMAIDVISASGPIAWGVLDFELI